MNSLHSYILMNMPLCICSISLITVSSSFFVLLYIMFDS